MTLLLSLVCPFPSIQAPLQEALLLVLHLILTQYNPLVLDHSDEPLLLLPFCLFFLFLWLVFGIGFGIGFGFYIIDRGG